MRRGTDVQDHRGGNGAQTNTAETARSPQQLMKIEEPTPSPLFPPDLAYLMRLPEADTKELLKHYGIVKYKRVPIEKTGNTAESENDANFEATEEVAAVATKLIEESESREDSLNRFLKSS